jgi:predicted glycosyltransferase
VSRIKLLFYAINGTGLGHLTRLLAVARETRELLSALGLRADIRFLTSSEASEVAWDFPVYKLPSNTVAREVGLEQFEFQAESKLLVSNLIAGFSPDVLTVDTVPQGSYREMSFVRGYARRTVYIDRHKDPTVSGSELYQKHVALYDKVLVPDYEEAKDRYLHPKSCLSKRVFVGPIHGFCPSQTLTTSEVRTNFGVAPGQRLIYLSGGGGGDSRAFLEQLTLALAQNPSNFLLVGLGPLHRGECLHAKNVIPLFKAEARRYFPGVDAAVSAAGYNTYQELLAAGVPTLFFAQAKGMDRQDQRVEQGEKNGWHLSLPTLDLDLAQSQVAKLFDEEVRAGIKEILQARPVAQGKTVAATELLALHSSLAGSPVSRPKLYQVARWRLSWQPCKEEPFSETAVTARRWLKHVCRPESLDQLQEEALVKWYGDSKNSGNPASDTPSDQAVLSWARLLNSLGPDLSTQLIRAWCHGNLTTAQDEAEQRQRAVDVMNILREHEDDWRAVLEIILYGFKRPLQREALRSVTERIDTENNPALLQELMKELRRMPQPWGAKAIELLKGTREVAI